MLLPVAPQNKEQADWEEFPISAVYTGIADVQLYDPQLLNQGAQVRIRRWGKNFGFFIQALSPLFFFYLYSFFL